MLKGVKRATSPKDIINIINSCTAVAKIMNKIDS